MHRFCPIARPSRSTYAAVSRRDSRVIRRSPRLNGLGKYSSLTARATRMAPPNPPACWHLHPWPGEWSARRAGLRSAEWRGLALVPVASIRASVPCALVVGRKKRIVSGHDRPRVNAAARLAESGLLDHASSSSMRSVAAMATNQKSRRQRRVHHADRLTPRPDARRGLATTQRKVTFMRTEPSDRTRGAKNSPSARRTGSTPTWRLMSTTGPAGSWGADRIVEIPERPGEFDVPALDLIKPCDRHRGAPLPIVGQRERRLMWRAPGRGDRRAQRVKQFGTGRLLRPAAPGSAPRFQTALSRARALPAPAAGWTRRAASSARRRCQTRDQRTAAHRCRRPRTLRHQAHVAARTRPVPERHLGRALLPPVPPRPRRISTTC